MANDPEISIRRIVAQRIDVDELGLLADDADWTVRYEVALRALPDLLQQLQHDAEEDVRMVAQQRYEELG